MKTNNTEINELHVSREILSGLISKVCTDPLDKLINARYEPVPISIMPDWMQDITRKAYIDMSTSMEV